jgi:hypothetical protein
VFSTEKLKGFIGHLGDFVQKRGPKSLFTNGLRQITINNETPADGNRVFFIRVWPKPLDKDAKLIYPVFNNMEEDDMIAYNTLVSLT